MLKLQYICLPEDEPLGLKHVEDIIKIKIIVKQRCILLVYIIRLYYNAKNIKFPPSLLPFHNISLSVPFIVLDIQHFLQPFTIISGERHCRSIFFHIDWTTHVCFWVYKLTQTHEDWQFSPQMVLGVLRNLNTCVLVFCVMFVVWSVWVHGPLYGF